MYYIAITTCVRRIENCLCALINSWLRILVGSETREGILIVTRELTFIRSMFKIFSTLEQSLKKSNDSKYAIPKCHFRQKGYTKKDFHQSPLFLYLERGDCHGKMPTGGALKGRQLTYRLCPPKRLNAQCVTRLRTIRIMSKRPSIFLLLTGHAFFR